MKYMRKICYTHINIYDIYKIGIFIYVEICGLSMSHVCNLYVTIYDTYMEKFMCFICDIYARHI